MAGLVPTDPLESLTRKLIDYGMRGSVPFVTPWELRSVLNELRARRTFCDVFETQASDGPIDNEIRIITTAYRQMQKELAEQTP